MNISIVTTIISAILGPVILELIKYSLSRKKITPASSSSWSIKSILPAVLSALLFGVFGFIAGRQIEKDKLINPILINGFESKADLSDWSPVEAVNISRSAKSSYKGFYSLAVEISHTSPNDNILLVKWDVNAKGDFIIGRIFWPKDDNANISWAQICISGYGNCYSIPTTRGKWNVFAINLYAEEFTEEELTYYIQAGLHRKDEDTKYVFYIDEVEFYTR